MAAAHASMEASEEQNRVDPRTGAPAENGVHLGSEERELFLHAMQALDREGVPFLIAGAFGLMHHTGLWRGTKDLDLVILPEHRDTAVQAVCGVGLHDMFPEEAYDREWIFRATRDAVIVDLIWRMANKADDVAPSWFERGAEGTFLGRPVRYVSAADVCWMKLFVLQRQRCDWPDIINVIRGTAGNLDWEHLLAEVGSHWRLLCAIVDLYDWLCPPERAFIPAPFRRALEQLRRQDADGAEPCRQVLLDSRPWLTEPGAGLSR